MTSQEACLEWSVYTFSSGSNGWLRMVPRSVKGLTCEAMRAARLARLSGGGGQGGYAGDAPCDVL